MKRTKRILLLVCGTLCILLAVLGMFLPVLPTTPFLLLASYCFARSSERLNHWLVSNKLFGQYIRNYHEGRGIPLRHKVITLILLWLTIGYAAWMASFWWLKVLLLCVAAGVSIHLAMMRSHGSGAAGGVPIRESESAEGT